MAYNTNFVSEVGRDTCDYAGGEDFMIAEDLYENILRQKINVMDAAKHSNRILFVDTDALTTMFYSWFLLGDDSVDHVKCTKLAKAVNNISYWDLVIFLEPDVEFVQDGTRSEEIAQNRIEYSEKIKHLLRKSGIEFFTIGGDYLNRFNKAKELIENVLGLTTVW